MQQDPANLYVRVYIYTHTHTHLHTHTHTDSFRSDVEAFVQQKDPYTFKAQEVQVVKWLQLVKWLLCDSGSTVIAGNKVGAFVAGVAAGSRHFQIK